MGIIAKLKTSFEATKQLYESWAAFGASLAIASICALVGLMIWVADYIGPVPACFVFSALFLVIAGISKFVIDAKGREAQENFSAAKNEVAEDVSAITQPLNVARQFAPGRVSPAVPVVLFASMICVAYLMKNPSVE